jgi:hypothetical protein
MFISEICRHTGDETLKLKFSNVTILTKLVIHRKQIYYPMLDMFKPKVVIGRYRVTAINNLPCTFSTIRFHV